MQIELIGSTSAGKSTLAEGIVRAGHERGMDVLLGEDFALTQVRLNWVKSSLLRKLLLNLAALDGWLITWRANREIYLFVARFLFQLPISAFQKLNTLRNVLKRIGIHEIIRAYDTGDQVILVDEGVLQAAHYLFVHESVHVETDHVSQYAGLVPLPDTIVYLKQPEALLIDRTMRRGHKRISDRSHNRVGRFIEQAVATFDELAQHPAVERKLLVVEGGQNVRIAANVQSDPAIGLALEIVQRGLAGRTTATPVEPVPAPGLYHAPTSAGSLLEKGA